MNTNDSNDPLSNFVGPTGKATVLRFAARTLAMYGGLEPWGHTALADAATAPASWRHLMLARILPAPLAGELATNPVAVSALAKAVREPDISSMAGMREERAPLEHIPWLTGPAYCVLVGVPLSDNDCDLEREEISGWDAIVVLDESREEPPRLSSARLKIGARHVRAL